MDLKKAFDMPGAKNVAGDDHAGHDHSPASAATSAATNSTAPKPNDTSDPGHGGLGHSHATDPKDRDKRWFQAAKGKLIIGTALLLAAAWAVKLFGSETLANYAFIAVCVIGVAPVAVRAFAALRAGIPFTVEALMTIAAIGALFIGAAEEAALVVFLFAVGEVLEGVAADKARASIRALADLVPKTAILEENGATRKVDAATLQIGQRVLVRPGSRIPADGEIAEGTSGVDESPVTDESMPKTKGPGDPVFAGSINAEAVLRITVNRPGFAGDQIVRVTRPYRGCSGLHETRLLCFSGRDVPDGLKQAAVVEPVCKTACKSDQLTGWNSVQN